MKTTTENSKLNQKENATEVDQAKQQSDTQNTVPNGSVVTEETSKLSGDQFDLPLEVADTLAMNTDESDDAKKRKDKKEDAEKDSKKLEVAEDSDTDAIDAEVQVDEEAEEVVGEGGRRRPRGCCDGGQTAH